MLNQLMKAKVGNIGFAFLAARKKQKLQVVVS